MADENTTLPKESRKKRLIPIPKDSASFFRVRAKHPTLFQFTADGNLQVPEMRGEAAKVIELPFYRPSLPEELIEYETIRRNELIHIEKEYDEALQNLKDSMFEWKTTGAASDVIQAQRELARLDAVRSQLRSPLRFTKEFKGLSIRELLVDKFYEVKKVRYPCFALALRTSTFDELVKVGEPNQEVQVESEAEAETLESFVFFFDPAAEHGALSPDTMIDFVYNSTKYTSILQAYEVERITQLGRRKDLGSIFLKLKTPAQIRAMATKVTGDVENPRELWIDILKTLVSQHPEYSEVLKNTNNDTLVYANPKDIKWGIGLSADDPMAMERSEWKGPNILGQAWQAVRSSLEPTVQAGGYTEHGATKEEGMELRKRVLKGYYKRKGAQP